MALLRLKDSQALADKLLRVQGFEGLAALDAELKDICPLIKGKSVVFNDANDASMDEKAEEVSEMDALLHGTRDLHGKWKSYRHSFSGKGRTALEEVWLKLKDECGKGVSEQLIMAATGDLVRARVNHKLNKGEFAAAAKQLDQDALTRFVESETLRSDLQQKYAPDMFKKIARVHGKDMSVLANNWRTICEALGVDIWYRNCVC